MTKKKIPDLDIVTSVKAKEVRFGRVPETRLWFDGEPGQQSESKIERDNLPEEVEPDVTYRDVTVNWTVASRLVHPTDDAEEES